MTMTLARILALPIIGEGNFRRVYRDGPTVYKIEHGEGIDFASNQAEVDNLDRLRAVSLPKNVRLPDAYLYHDGVPIVAMEYIDGVLMGDCHCIPGESHDETCLPGEVVEKLLSLGIDTAYGNVILSDGTYFIVDLDADLR